MTPRARTPAPSRPRRSHAERTAETRSRVKAAVIESIAEVGYQKTTGAEIARRAGVTWGAVQHHFGSKDGILAAVLEDSFNRFASGLAEAFEVLGEGAPLEKRIETFIDAAWDHFGGSYYRATFEILLEDSASRRVGGSEEDEDVPLLDFVFRAGEDVDLHRDPLPDGDDEHVVLPAELKRFQG